MRGGAHAYANQSSATACAAPGSLYDHARRLRCSYGLGSTSNVTGSGSAVSLSTGAADPQGTLKLNGSSALLPLMQLAADWYQAKHPGVYFVVAGSNSGAGRRLVCEGSIDLGTSDVPLTAAGTNQLNRSNAVQIPVAIQAFAPVANQLGPGKLTSLTKAQLVDIFSGKVANWKELGGDDQAIVLINRVPGSGTRGIMTITSLTATTANTPPASWRTITPQSSKRCARRRARVFLPGPCLSEQPSAARARDRQHVTDEGDHPGRGMADWRPRLCDHKGATICSSP